jgi:hypothetical protein
MGTLGLDVPDVRPGVCDTTLCGSSQRDVTVAEADGPEG